jgi:hypothetical protein
MNSRKKELKAESDMDPELIMLKMEVIITNLPLGFEFIPLKEEVRNLETLAKKLGSEKTNSLLNEIIRKSKENPKLGHLIKRLKRYLDYIR